MNLILTSYIFAVEYRSHKSFLILKLAYDFGSTDRSWINRPIVFSNDSNNSKKVLFCCAEKWNHLSIITKVTIWDSNGIESHDPSGSPILLIDS